MKRNNPVLARLAELQVEAVGTRSALADVDDLLQRIAATLNPGQLNAFEVERLSAIATSQGGAPASIPEIGISAGYGSGKTYCGTCCGREDGRAEPRLCWLRDGTNQRYGPPHLGTKVRGLPRQFRHPLHPKGGAVREPHAALPRR